MTKEEEIASLEEQLRIQHVEAMKGSANFNKQQIDYLRANLETMSIGTKKRIAMTIMPAQRPHRSEQIVETPKDFLDAVAARFGRLDFDLACTRENAKAADGFFHPGADALDRIWSSLTGNLWLNPPYTDLGAWASKCRSELMRTHDGGPHGTSFFARKWDRILLLTPASVGSNWWAKHVDGQAAVYFLSPRLTFVGHSSSYPKDLALSVYGENPGYECWRWKK